MLWIKYGLLLRETAVIVINAIGIAFALLYINVFIRFAVDRVRTTPRPWPSRFRAPLLTATAMALARRARFPAHRTPEGCRTVTDGDRLHHACAAA